MEKVKITSEEILQIISERKERSNNDLELILRLKFNIDNEFKLYINFSKIKLYR